MKEGFTLRLARPEDAPILEALILASVHGLQAGTYTEAQREAALGPVFCVDDALIEDGTYFVVEAVAEGRIVGCGGWSRRQAKYGRSEPRSEDGAKVYLDPTHDAARIRAFFVHPDFARQGIGRALLLECERALQRAGFTSAVLSATLAGVPLYTAMGYVVEKEYEAPLKSRDGSYLGLPIVRMSKSFASEGRVSAAAAECDGTQS